MQRIKPFILPIAIVLGLLLHTQTVMVAWIVPYIIFTILLLNFTAVDLKTLKFNKLDLCVMIFQAVVSLGGYYLVKLFVRDEILAQAALISVLCPVASSVVVVASALGADRRTTTGYTIYGNLLVAVVAPIYFSFIGVNQHMPFFDSAWVIFKKIAIVIALPYFVALILQFLLPKVSHAMSRLKDWTLILWACALLMTLGQTIDYVFLYHKGNEQNIVWLAIISILVCAVQFGVGRLIGRIHDEPIAGGQLLGQKNTAFGIWMASIYLTPLASVVLAFYFICQNLWNSWQMYIYTKNKSVDKSKKFNL